MDYPPRGPPKPGHRDRVKPLLAKLEEAMIEHNEMRNTVFGEVLCELFESRDLLLTPEAVEEYVDACGCYGEDVVNRMASTDEGCGPLDELADDLVLTVNEKTDLAMANAFEKRSHYRMSV